MNKCKTCGKDTKNKVYCCVKCQHEGYKIKKVRRITKVCEYCGRKFEVKETSSHPHRFCSRNCTDLWKKEYGPIGINHWTTGTKHTKEWKINMSNKMKKIWESKTHRQKVAVGQQNFFNKNGRWWGHGDVSNARRKNTLLDKYGIEHNWNGKYGNRNCDKTCVKRHGKTSVELMNEGITENTWDKRRRSTIENRYNITFDEYIKTLPQKKHYYAEVWRITNRHNLSLLENCEKRGRSGVDGAYQLDHIIPISYGFYNNISLEIIGNIENLRFITWEENREKWNKYEERSCENKNKKKNT